MNRVRRFCHSVSREKNLGEMASFEEGVGSEDAASDPQEDRLSWNYFLIFSKHLVNAPYDRFSDTIDVYISKIDNYLDKVSASEQRKAREMDRNRDMYLAEG
mmetsp:Transcript_9920/g.18726  ORF Transcript_9920/g.18726 Transcript_9920/m.18726 type:complete len:102 (+) Transcript_9920:429-734(+)